MMAGQQAPGEKQEKSVGLFLPDYKRSENDRRKTVRSKEGGRPGNFAS
jgi:hypothetical protein